MPFVARQRNRACPDHKELNMQTITRYCRTLGKTLSPTHAIRLTAAAVAVMTMLTLPAYSQEDGGGREQSHASDVCSNRTLSGDYAFRIDGTVFAPALALVRGVAMTHFDGHGGLTQMDYATVNGRPLSADWRPATGTYAVNSDCTGTAEINGAGAPPLRLRLVVTRQGKEIYTLVEGNASGSVGVKRE
jgi:hypothetical protein